MSAVAVLDHPCVACALGRHDRCPGCVCAEARHDLSTDELLASPVAPVRTMRAIRGEDGPSPDQRRTLRQKDQLAAGMHPATRRTLLAGAGSTCGTCVHAFQVMPGNRRHWKCEQHYLGPSRSAASDIRVSWPACQLYERSVPADDGHGPGVGEVQGQEPEAEQRHVDRAEVDTERGQQPDDRGDESEDGHGLNLPAPGGFSTAGEGAR